MRRMVLCQNFEVNAIVIVTINAFNFLQLMLDRCKIDLHGGMIMAVYKNISIWPFFNGWLSGLGWSVWRVNDRERQNLLSTEKYSGAKLSSEYSIFFDQPLVNLFAFYREATRETLARELTSSSIFSLEPTLMLR
jgi:hypothetical protein